MAFNSEDGDQMNKNKDSIFYMYNKKELGLNNLELQTIT